MRDFFKNFLIVFTFLLVVAGVLGFVNSGKGQKPEVVGVAQLVEEINQGKIKSIVVQGDTITATMKDDGVAPQTAKKEIGDSFGDIIKNYPSSQTHLIFHYCRR